ncbi:MAG TPA: hypothetical protein DCM40_21185 [Maribacter sp.]|nr:hypothetical protein [Maribacter sp.]
MSKIVWTNGCFDVFHRGHFEMLKYAKSLGEHLIVGIDTDTKVKTDKGPARPFNSQDDRKFALESIRYVDEVILFDSPEELENLIKVKKPDIMVIGSDWKGKKVVGDEHCDNICFFDRIPNYSTTKILESNK